MIFKVLSSSIFHEFPLKFVLDGGTQNIFQSKIQARKQNIYYLTTHICYAYTNTVWILELFCFFKKAAYTCI